jgi:hypothetical protein
VEGITYIAPPELNFNGNTIYDQVTGKPKQKTGNLNAYWDDPGTYGGLNRSDRVRVLETAKPLEGVPAGRPLKVGDSLYVGDNVLINAEKLKSIRGDVVMSGGITLAMRFFDGFVGKVGVGGNVPSHVVKIGPTPEKTGFTSWAASFIHWGSMIGSEINPMLNPKSYMIKAGIKQIAPEFLPYYSAYKKGMKIIEPIELIYEMKPVYIGVESAIAVDYDAQGQMLITTREGNANIFTEATGVNGFSVPAGKTAVIPPDLNPILKDTDSKTAQDADDLLSNLEDPFATSLVSEPGAATSGMPSGNNSIAPSAVSSGVPGSGNVMAGAAQREYPDLSGIWYMGGPYSVGMPCHILQDGGTLTFINEKGDQSVGKFVDSGTVMASDWQGLNGEISDGGKRINWSNGSWWVRQSGNEQLPGTLTTTPQGGCYKDPMTGEITCVGSNGNPLNTQFEPSSSVPQSMQECEIYTSEICGTWTREGDHINAVWNNGATATLNVESWSPAGVVLTRYDSGGSSAGLSARYEGQINGNKIESGKVTWNWKGSIWSGTWKAGW